jgi:hypothetical protein
MLIERVVTPPNDRFARLHRSSGDFMIPEGPDWGAAMRTIHVGDEINTQTVPSGNLDWFTCRVWNATGFQRTIRRLGQTKSPLIGLADLACRRSLRWSASRRPAAIHSPPGVGTDNAFTNSPYTRHKPRARFPSWDDVIPSGGTASIISFRQGTRGVAQRAAVQGHRGKWNRSASAPDAALRDSAPRGRMAGRERRVPRSLRRS